MTQQNHLRGVLLASSACILWGISGVAASTLFINNPHLTAMWLTQVRMISAGLILLVWGMVAGKHPFKIGASPPCRLDSGELRFAGADSGSTLLFRSGSRW